MGTPTTAMHKLLLLVAGVSCAPNNGPNSKLRGRELTALRALLPAMRRCLSTGRRWPRTTPGKRSLSTGKSKRSPLRKDKLLMVQQSLPWRSYRPNLSNTSTVCRTTTVGTRSPRRKHRTTWVKCSAATRLTSQMVVFRLSPTMLIMREALLQRSHMREPHSTLSHLRVDMDPTRDLALTLAPLPLAPTQEGDSDQDARHYLLSFVNNVNTSLK